jgi:hypothetical protein
MQAYHVLRDDLERLIDRLETRSFVEAGLGSESDSKLFLDPALDVGVAPAALAKDGLPPG